MIELEAVTLHHGRRRELHVLDQLALTVGQGELVVIAGASGSGKTSLVRLLAGELRPTSGTIRLFDHDLARLRRASWPQLRRRVGVVHQRPALLWDRSALDNVALALEVQAVPRDEMAARAASALGLVGLGERVDQVVSELSVGEQQRVAVARALVGKPAVLVVDEPTGQLDISGTARLLDIFRGVNDAGTAVVITTNDRVLIEASVQRKWRTLALEQGQLRQLTVHRDVLGKGKVVPFPLAVGSALESERIK